MQMIELPDISIGGSYRVELVRLEAENRLFLVLSKCEAFLREQEAFFRDWEIYAEALDLVRRWELADPKPPPDPPPRPYRNPSSSIAAFKHVRRAWRVARRPSP